MECAAYLFGNGNAMYFDESGSQISNLQGHGLSGVHEFIRQHPDAPIYWSIWGEAKQQIHPNVLKYIIHPQEFQP